MADLTPKTRSESFLNGEDLEPITRREHFYAGRENDLPEGHQEPETREEWFIQKYREAGDVTVESLSITENGTYTAPSGKAYSPVSVDVPLPSNAYLLKSIEHEQVATFTDGTDNFLKSLEVAIEPQQDLHGYDNPWVGGAGKNKFNIATISVKEYIGGNGNLYPSNNWSVSDFISVDSEIEYVLSGITNSGSLAKHAFYDSNKVFISAIDSTVMNFTTPSNAKYIRLSLQSETPTNVQLEKGTTATAFAPYSNICPISGWTEAYVVISYMVLYNIQFKDGDNPLTVYGGSLDVVNGVLNDGLIDLVANGSEAWSENGSSTNLYRLDLTSAKVGSILLSDKFKQTTSSASNMVSGEMKITSNRYLDVKFDGATSLADWKTWLSNNNTQFIYEPTEATTYQLTPTIIKSLQGDNNFFASTGEIERMQYWGEVS